MCEGTLYVVSVGVWVCGCVSMSTVCRVMLLELLAQRLIELASDWL